MKLCAIVITYYPDVAETLRNCMAYIDHVDTLIVWENTPGKDREQYRIDLGTEYADKVVTMGDGTNHCIAKPLNIAAKWARERGFTYLLTMDQDSLFESGAFERYKEVIDRNKNDKTIGIFGANPYRNFPDNNEPLEELDVITSGTVYDLAMLEQIGEFREDFEIDGVDTEMCYRALKHGFKTVVIGLACMIHECGKQEKTRFGFYIDNYSPFRLYHLTRNHLVLWFLIFPRG